MFKKIVVGIDGSKPAENALRIACDLARKYDSELHLVHTPKAETVAFALGAVAGYHVATTMPSPKERKEAGEKVLSAGLAICDSCGSRSPATHIGDGDPADDLLECAETCGADLIVTGRRGLGNLTAAVLGSTSQKISHHAKCACLTVA